MPPQTFYLQRNSAKYGPYDRVQLQELARQGKVRPTDLILIDGKDRWVAADKIKGLLGQAPPAALPSAAVAPSPPVTAVAIQQPAPPPPSSPSSNPPSPAVKPRQDFWPRLLDGGKIAAPLCGFVGFIGDFLKPLASFNGYLFVAGVLVVSALTFLFYRQERGIRYDFSRWFPQRCLLFGVYFLAAMAVWLALEQFGSDSDKGFVASHLKAMERVQTALLDLKKDIKEVREATTAIHQDTKEIKKGGEQTLVAVTNVDAKLDDVRRSLRQSIGNKKLGPEYENTQFHRQYQNEFLEKEENNRAPLIAEYQQLAASAPANAMYRYLLARLYDADGKYDEAISEAKAGLKADPNYFWNRRFMLYVAVTSPLDLESRLAAEVDYYRISDDEKKMFASGEPVQFIKAFEQIKQRFRDDPAISRDLKDRLCWHLFRALSQMAFEGGKSFRNLIGKEAVSPRDLLRLKVLDVKTGPEALALLPAVSTVVITHEQRQQQIGRSTLVRNQQVRKDVHLQRGQLLHNSLKLPPVALRLSVQPARPGIDLTLVKNRSFTFGGHVTPPPSELVKSIFGGPVGVDPRKLMPVSIEQVDTADFSSPRDVWVYFLALPVHWRATEECLLTFDFNVEVGARRTVLADQIVLSNKESKNLTKAPIDALTGLELYQKLRRMKPGELKGQRIDQPLEAKVWIQFNGETKVQIFGIDDMKMGLIYNAKGLSPETRKIGSELALKWPTAAVQETLSTLANGQWVRFTGTVLLNKAGELFIIPDSAHAIE